MPPPVPPYHHANTWNAPAWLADFRAASDARRGFRQLRAGVFQSTLRFVAERGYRLHDSERDTRIPLPEEALAACHAGTRFYESTDDLPVPPALRNQRPGLVSVVNLDCLEAAASLITEGYRPALLNMANPHRPGGGVLGGAGAQEENVFRRSALHYSLYQYSPEWAKFDVPPSPREQRYPIGEESGAVYSPEVLVFRSSEATGYALLPAPYRLGIISVPAIAGPELERGRGEWHLAGAAARVTARKIRAILRVGAAHGHDALVLSAFGCGAFGNPPGHMARLFAEALAEEEFAGVFSRIVFAIIDDHNAGHEHNPEGNFLPFYRIFR